MLVAIADTRIQGCFIFRVDAGVVAWTLQEVKYLKSLVFVFA
jgi:hypothetical protein